MAVVLFGFYRPVVGTQGPLETLGCVELVLITIINAYWSSEQGEIINNKKIVNKILLIIAFM